LEIVVHYEMTHTFVPILSTHVSTTSYSEVVELAIPWAKKGESRSIYAANVHMLMEAHDSPEFRAIVNKTDIVTPDGMPLVWAMHMKGIKNQQRVYGPTLMLHLLATAAKEQISVGLVGSTEEVLNILSVRFREQYPGLNIALQIAPPFRPLTDDEDKKMVQQINGSGVHLLFVGLGCPKQEYWIASHQDFIHSVMVGVGAAFDFHAGMVTQAPGWMQRAGLEWLFRLMQEPRRLWKRYLRNNPRFMLLLFGELIKERWKRQ
jgi:N-acetylglucosaminyldiphosphoundecaprenol N-acetyl-beta-D-mannosaminyltransferase